MIDKKLLTKIILAVLGLIIFFFFIPTFNFSQKKSSSSFGVIKRSSNNAALPSSLKWGTDFNYNYEKMKKDKGEKRNTKKARLDYFKNKK